MSQRDNELKNTTYEIFVGLLSILSIVNIVLYIGIPNEDISMVIAIMDSFLTVIFLGDFLYRLFTAESKAHYFLRQFGWADFLASLPFPQAKILRGFRIFRVYRLLREFGLKGIYSEFLANRAKSALLSLLLFVILLLEFGGMAILSVEQNVPGANIQTGSDAVWYTFVTITTVGYGDTYPVSNNGRLIGLLIMAVGVGLFGTLTGFLSNFFLGGDSAVSDSAGEFAVADTTPVTTSGGELDHDPKSKLAELKQLLAEQQASQAALARKIEEIESLL
jgi:voltage-gated potassium channel Kch